MLWAASVLYCSTCCAFPTHASDGDQTFQESLQNVILFLLLTLISLLQVQQRDQNSQSARMILRFRDDKIRRLEGLVAGKIPVDNHLVEENKQLAEELKLVRTQIDRNPELTRFAMENIRLQEQVRGYGHPRALNPDCLFRCLNSLASILEF